MSFWKQEPPKPTLAFKNLGPMRESKPIALATSSMLAPVASQMAESALMEEIRCASMALAANLDNSDDQRPTARIRSLLLPRQTRVPKTRRSDTYGTQLAYTSANAVQASIPSGVWSDPMSTRSGFNRSLIAVPSARNSGLDRISK